MTGYQLLLILNGMLMGIMAIIFWQFKAYAKSLEDTLDKVLATELRCKDLVKGIANAHNDLARQVLEIQDKQKAWELRAQANLANFKRG